MILFEVVENVLKPPFIEKSFPSGSPEQSLLVSTYQKSPEQLASISTQDPDAENLRLALFFCSPIEDFRVSFDYLDLYFDAYAKLRSYLNARYLQALDSAFFYVLYELSSHYQTLAQFIKICEKVEIMKNTGLDISPLIDSIRTYYSSFCMTAIKKIFENIENFDRPSELIRAEIKAIEIGLGNENTTSMVAEAGLDFVEHHIGNLKLAAHSKNGKRLNSELILGLISKLGELPDISEQRLRRFCDLVGILKVGQKKGKANYFKSKIENLYEDSQDIFSYNHYEFHVEVKKGLWKNKEIVIKKYLAVDGAAWKPDRLIEQIKILENCSELAKQGQPFLLLYGNYLLKGSLWILLEFQETDLEKKIFEYKRLKKKFTNEEINKIVTRLVLGFSLLEQIDIVHNDINSSNILISGSGANIDVKIIDFDVSKFECLGMYPFNHARIMTTSWYRAPELVGKNSATFNPFKADVYSLGLVFYQLYDVNLDLTDINNPNKQRQLLDKVSRIDNIPIKNLLSNMFLDSSSRPTFRELIQYLP